MMGRLKYDEKEKTQETRTEKFNRAIDTASQTANKTAQLLGTVATIATIVVQIGGLFKKGKENDDEL